MLPLVILSFLIVVTLDQETYYRLLAPSLLLTSNKAIYLDSDLVVNTDIAELYDIDVTGYLVEHTRDADTIGKLMDMTPQSFHLKNSRYE